MNGITGRRVESLSLLNIVCIKWGNGHKPLLFVSKLDVAWQEWGDIVK